MTQDRQQAQITQSAIGQACSRNSETSIMEEYLHCAAYALFITHLIAKPHSSGIEGLHFGLAYAAGMLALTGMVMLAAGRLWTVGRLLPYLPERPVGAAFNAAR
jgi:hypothetical protein